MADNDNILNDQPERFSSDQARQNLIENHLKIGSLLLDLGNWKVGAEYDGANVAALRKALQEMLEQTEIWHNDCIQSGYGYDIETFSRIPKLSKEPQTPKS